MNEMDRDILTAIAEENLDALSSKYNPKDLAIAITNLAAEGLVDRTVYPYRLTEFGEQVLSEPDAPTVGEMDEMARYYGEERYG